MSIAPAKQKSGRKAPTARIKQPLTRLVPPPGRKAAEVADLLPPPSPDFDAEIVERIIANRSSR